MDAQAGVVRRGTPTRATSGTSTWPPWVNERVWCYGAQWYRPFGTAAQFDTVPEEQAVRLPDSAGYGLGACLGIPV